MAERYGQRLSTCRATRGVGIEDQQTTQGVPLSMLPAQVTLIFMSVLLRTLFVASSSSLHDMAMSQSSPKSPEAPQKSGRRQMYMDRYFLTSIHMSTADD